MPIRLTGYGRARTVAQSDEAAVGAGTVFTPLQRWGLLAGFVLLVVFRLPHAWTHGRFLDEEATVFLAYAWHRPWLDALFRSFAGYMNLSANATTVVAVALVKAGVVPLERAPYLTMGMALLAQMLPAVLILTGHARWLAGRTAVIAALLILAITPSTEEVFYNVLHIQFHLALCAVLILSLDPPRRRIVGVGYGVLLFLAPLSGPGAIVILPVFALRAVIERDRARLGQLAAFAAGAAVQLLLFYGASPVRGHLFDPGAIAMVIFVRLIALPAFGIEIANGMAVAIYQSRVAGGSGWLWTVAVTVALFAALIVAAARRRDAALWLLLSSLAIAVASFGFGAITVDSFDLFRVGNGERYTFLPLVLIGLALVVMAMRRQSRAAPVYGLLCLLMVLTGAAEYAMPVRVLNGGPSWPAEVAAWRRDHHHLLAVWPRPYKADLSDEAPPCSPPGTDPALSKDPRYCESGWASGFHRASQPARP